jgi:hypothetical protein
LRSVLQASLVTKKRRKTFLGVFVKQKQKVLWKWETEEMADKLSNIKLVKWLPQQDILGHKATRLFITHSGQSSTQGCDSLNISGANHEMHAAIYGSAKLHKVSCLFENVFTTECMIFRLRKKNYRFES